MELLTIENQRIRLSNLIGQVILMRFSDFAKSDWSALIYLNHIQEKFKSSGLQVIYVKTQSSWQDPKLHNPLYFKPLVESDGLLENIFNGKAGDTILVDRNFNIRFKLNNLSNYFLYSQVYKFLFEDKPVSQGLEDREIARLLMSYDFIDIENGRKEKIKEAIENKRAIIMLFISQCFHCEEHKRITLLREMARIAKTGALVMLLFGEGNDLDSIEAFAKRNKIFGVMKIGIIQTTGESSRTEYHQLFDFEVDPRIIIYDEKAEPVFIENRENRKLVNPDYLRGFLG